jgi:hypothetical protein
MRVFGQRQRTWLAAPTLAQRPARLQRLLRAIGAEDLPLVGASVYHAHGEAVTEVYCVFAPGVLDQAAVDAVIVGAGEGATQCPQNG